MRLTQQQNEQIAAFYEAGFTPSQIATELGTTPGTVHHRLNRMVLHVGLLA
ncbi:helix-turn-helix domain-containing protein [Glaciihabitans sp. UYNi722]|uniref:helix-turn-helix domain-containing protein n=1 Tax=Glaciihabitans sp. UYNi722 TaxID=3156344 RepID=UPI003398909B